MYVLLWQFESGFVSMIVKDKETLGLQTPNGSLVGGKYFSHSVLFLA